MQGNTCQVHYLNINDLFSSNFKNFSPFFFSRWESPSPLLHQIWCLYFLLNEIFHLSPAHWAACLCHAIIAVTQLSHPSLGEQMSSLGKDKLSAKAKEAAGWFRARAPKFSPHWSKRKKKVKIKVTFRFQSRLEFPRFRLVLIRGLNQIAKLKLPGPLGILQLQSKILLKAPQVWILFHL